MNRATDLADAPSGRRTVEESSLWSAEVPPAEPKEKIGVKDMSGDRSHLERARKRRILILSQSPMRQLPIPIGGHRARRAPERAEGGSSNRVAANFHARAGFRPVASRNLHHARDRPTGGGPIRMSSHLILSNARDSTPLRPLNTRQTATRYRKALHQNAIHRSGRSPTVSHAQNHGMGFDRSKSSRREITHERISHRVRFSNSRSDLSRQS